MTNRNIQRHFMMNCLRLQDEDDDIDDFDEDDEKDDDEEEDDEDEDEEEEETWQVRGGTNPAKLRLPLDFGD